MAVGYKNPATPADLAVRDWLAMIANMESMKSGGVRPEAALFYERLNNEGRFYAPKPLPKRYKARPQKQCFKNAFDLAVKTRAALMYVEGFAFCYIPTHHAWVVDDQGNVIDPTWAEIAVPYAERSYFGIVVPKKTLQEKRSLSRSYGMFEDS
jgi:hypothetical protein